MISAFPSPILSVAADVVKDLEGEDALCGLWALFTKCKESLKDGRRLENISWRLWYREMASAQSSPASSPGSLSPSLSDRRSPSPITPISEDGAVAHHVRLCHPPPNIPPDIAQAHSWHGDPLAHPPKSGGRRLSTLSTVSAPMERRKSHSSVGVGKVILDILPCKVDVDSEKQARSHVVPGIVQPRPIVAALPTVQLPATPPHPEGPSFPRVVVVNPTPHPTPPATPSLPHAPTLTAGAQTSTHLLPPAPARSLVSATISPAPASTQPSVPSTTAPQPPTGAASSSASKRASNDAPFASQATPNNTSAKAYNDETLKASDRRFFLQDGSPDVDSPERPASNKASEPQCQSPSSGTSSHMKSEIAGPSAATGAAGAAIGPHAAHAKRPRVQVRKSKERHVPVRPALQRLHSHGARQASQQKRGALAALTSTAAEPKKAAFNIGSVSSTGSRAGPSTKASSRSENGDVSIGRARPAQGGAATAAAAAAAPAKQPPPPQLQPPPPQPAGAAAAGPSQQRRGIVISTSSEYETTSDTDDDSDWASEGDSAEEREKTKSSKKRETAEEARLREAAEEAQRQRDMFAKVPKRSYSNLNRTRSGLLSQLLNPDPNIFPPNHPYRLTRSTQDMTQLGRQGPAPKLQMSKSSAAVPLAAQVTAQVPLAAAPTANDSNSNNNTRPSGYRPKGRPQEAELEDTESEDDNPDDTIQVSRSLAQQKLEALADPSRRRHSDRGLLSQQRERQQHHQQMQEAAAGGGRPGLTQVATAPIPLNHPYNLPPPAPPMTPRTTRRQMLQTELSESLRRNLLWERQVSRVNMTTGRRGGLLGSGLRPLTTMNGDAPAPPQQTQMQQQSQPLPPQQQHAQQAQQPQHHSKAEREEQQRRAMARNRSWADDFHYSGW
ncbi:hypothetical protein PYCCODRAFT_1428948 [Trametes coccinea BRFM310]|uniref:Uncharacterized protein n=1 Tax=Trametes coccinea (strain BRFM310) TaxID=1353009 RepID=A0A1Y2I864_TRAC3|nr:hypothetical protein PYCCODRAFT_1428948 [Trametes coccinea BRFM310]